MRYQPSLDGLRGIAAMLVLLFHCDAPFFAGGYVGVDVFFVLSGFLITGLLNEEFDRTGRIDFRRFYWNRALRLFPPFLALLLVYSLAAPHIWPGYPHWKDVAISGLYLADYAIPAGFDLTYLRHTWSLAVEEQFYVVWPLAFLVALRTCQRSRLPMVISSLLVAALAWRAIRELSGWGAYYPLDARLPGLLAGAWVAAMAANGRSIALPRGWTMTAGAALLAAAVLWGPSSESELKVLGAIPLAELGAVLVITSPNRWFLDNPVLVWLGKISYGIYLWHYPVLKAVSLAAPPSMLLPMTAAISIGLAAVSYYTIEKAARSFRQRRNATAPQLGAS